MASRYWAIGSHKGLRWIIPHNPKYGLSVLRQWRPYSPISYLKWQLLLVAYRLRLLQRLPGVSAIAIAGVADKDWRHLGFEALCAQPVIYIGTPGPTRKAVVSIIDNGSHRLKGIAKVPLANGAKQKILQEANYLTRLATQKPGLAPQMLYVNSEAGIAVQTALTGKLTGTSLTSAHVDWFEQTHMPNCHTSLHQHVTALYTKIETSCDINTGVRTQLIQALEAIDDAKTLPAVWVHGDFVPWNLKWSGEHKLSAIDWEETYPNGLPLQDLFHFRYIQAHLLKLHTNVWVTARLAPDVA